MKAKEILYGIGIRPRTREYGYDIRHFDLEREGRIEYAQWRHPSALRRPTHVSQSEVDGLRRWLQDGDIAIDIGAHAGDTSLPLALAVGSAGTVLAFEPNLYAFKILLANAGLNRTKSNIHAYPFAATESEGTFTFEYSDPGFCNGGMHVDVGRWKHAHFFNLEVEGRVIPEFIYRHYVKEVERLRFIKIDTEGQDHAVFRSLRVLVERFRPVIRTEIYKHMPESARVAYLQDIESSGYSVRRVRDDADFTGEPITQSDTGRSTSFDVLAVPRD